MVEYKHTYYIYKHTTVRHGSTHTDNIRQVYLAEYKDTTVQIGVRITTTCNSNINGRIQTNVLYTMGVHTPTTLQRSRLQTYLVITTSHFGEKINQLPLHCLCSKFVGTIRLLGGRTKTNNRDRKNV